MKKKVLAGLLALALTLSLAACGGTEDPADETSDTTQETTQTEDPAGESEETQEEEAPAEDPEAAAEETPNTDAGESGSSTSNPGTGTSGNTTGSAKPSGGQGTSSQKPAQETPEKPAQEPQKPAADNGAASQPTQPPAEETSGSAPETPAEGTSSQVDLTAFAASGTSDQETWPGMMPMEGEALDSFYAGLSAIATKQCLVQMAMISASGDEIALVEVENSGDVQAVKDIFQARIDYQVGDGTAPGGAWYPAPTEMWKNESRIVSNGNFVMLVAHTGADSVVEQFNALFA